MQKTKVFLFGLGKVLVKGAWYFGVLSFIRGRMLRRIVNNQHPDHVLFVQLDNIGDVVFSTGLLKKYRQSFPNKKIYFLGHIATKGLVEPYVDEAIYIERKKIESTVSYSVKVIARLKHIGFKTVIHLSTNQLSSVAYHELWKRLNAREMVAYEGEQAFAKPRFWEVYEYVAIHSWWPRYKKYFTHVVKSVEVQSVKEHTHSSPHMLTSVFEHVAALSSYVLGEKVSAAEVMPVITTFDTVLSERYIVFGVGAAVDYRRWPIDRFADIAKKLIVNGYRIVLVGGKAEMALGETMEQLLDHSPMLRNMIGKTSFIELLGLLKHASLVLSNETSFAHLAVGLGAPSVCVLGGGHAGRCSHYGNMQRHAWVYDAEAVCLGDNWQCGEGLPKGVPAPCLDSVHVESVWSAVGRILTDKNA